MYRTSIPLLSPHPHEVDRNVLEEHPLMGQHDDEPKDDAPQPPPLPKHYTRVKKRKIVDGKIKAWLYDMLGSRVDYDAHGRSCTTMAYSADGRRLFSCGTSLDGESHIVEWNENEGHVKRTYQGLNKRSLGIVQFDSTKNRFLAVGDEYTIKV
ncbi:hypothetical protein SO802_029309 [Lithocarpus litseifolius]|uniref:Uncharacterized protein n=1 Tax=Lithocarpus litseifolius TaxID=425828 RepID=A0AAW2BYH3_9ROSI